MAGEKPRERKINWYRSPVDRETLNQLNQRSDWKGLAQSLGHLGLLALTGGLSLYAFGRWPFWAVLILLYLHGTFWAFLLNAFHELCHRTVFKSKSLNVFFLYLVSFLSWHHPVMFWASHQEHHKYTLHPPDDLEVTLPVPMTLSFFLKAMIANPWDMVGRIGLYVRWSFGKLDGQWEHHLFDNKPALQRDLFNWARFQIIGHLVISGIALAFGQWLVPVVFSLAAFYGGGLQFLCNNTQHIGLQDNCPDYRLCCRTITLNPFFEFLYWYMNYHTEHHMYAAVPCYNLARLHKAIRADLPRVTGLTDAWKEIIAILKQQKIDPSYQFVPELPNR
jgi:fatty acid desaturase